MTKLIATIFFSTILITTIVVPTYVSLVEGTCEITAVADLSEEEEKKGKESAKDLELKIYYSDSPSSIFIDLEKKKRIRFYSKNYVSYQKKQLSPPPEILA
ncbi:hypothetical protein AAON49_00610 [Pseudotenacibaculum sp. MALMAid0570]|uniref:hypothetical protein n=1 Tax=Pseudotenacibaculum sp. MALMAid0570 TaxID=3143938 RepID=UPI0032DFA8C6